MKRVERLMIGTLVMALMLAGSWANAQGTAPGETAKSKWEFEVIPYLWMAGLDGAVTVRGREAQGSASFSDLSSNLDFGAQAHVEARKDKWGIFFDVTYMDFSASGQTIRPPIPGTIEAEVSLTEWLIELGGLYQVAKWSLEKEKAIYLDMLGGGRYWELDMDLTLSNPDLGRSFKRSGSEDWIDPFVGLRLRANLSEKFVLALRGDIGGFGVSSDFSWNASVVLGYKITHLLSAWVGYRTLSVDYENGSGNDKFVYDATMHGPMLGVSFSF